MRIVCEGLYNVRDLGGMAGADGRAVRSGLLLRGDQPFSATEADKRLLVESGVRKVVDLRSVAEHEEKPDPAIDGVENLFLPVIQDVRAGITHGQAENARIGQMLMSGADVVVSAVEAYMANMYRQFVNDSFANRQYARLVDEVIASAQAGGGVYWHCTAGKDRAGFAAVVLLEALGVPRGDIVADYLLTNEYLAGFVTALVGRLGERLSSDAARAALTKFFLADESYLRAAYDEADRLFGSFDAFLSQAVQLDGAKRQTLRALLLDAPERNAQPS